MLQLSIWYSNHGTREIQIKLVNRGSFLFATNANTAGYPPPPPKNKIILIIIIIIIIIIIMPLLENKNHKHTFVSPSLLRYVPASHTVKNNIDATNTFI